MDVDSQNLSNARMVLRIDTVFLEDTYWWCGTGDVLIIFCQHVFRIYPVFSRAHASGDTGVNAVCQNCPEVALGTY